MIRAGIANDKTQAIEIGNLLMAHDVFRHASKVKQAFKDDYVFYRLTPKAAAANTGKLRSLQTSPKPVVEADEPLPLSLRAGLSPVPVSYKSPSVQDNAKKIKNFCNAANNPTTSLCLQGADLTPAQAMSIADCMRSQRLESLVFSSLCFGTIGDADSSGGLSALERLLASLIGLYLQSLVLQDLRFQVPLNSMPAAIMKQLTGLCSQLNLRSLSLNKCQLDEQSGKVLGTFLTTNTSLTQLDLSYNLLGPKGIEVLAGGLTGNSTLLSLTLANNGAGKGGADAISKALIVNSTLLLLDLQSNELGDEGCSLLVQGLGRNNTLASIDLRSNGITDTGAMIFQAVFSTNFCLVEVSIFGHLMYSPRSIPCEAFTERNKNLKVLVRPSARGANSSTEEVAQPEVEEEEWDDDDEPVVVKNLDLIVQPEEWVEPRGRARGVNYPAVPEKARSSTVSSRSRLPTQSGYVYGRVLQNAGWGADGFSFFGSGEATARARTQAVTGDGSNNKLAGKTSEQLITIIQQQQQEIDQQANQIASLKAKIEELTTLAARDKETHQQELSVLRQQHAQPHPPQPRPPPGDPPTKPRQPPRPKPAA